MDPPRTAAALIIGNELLTGKVRDQNLTALAATLFDVGIILRRAIFCLDDEETIAADLLELSRRHDWVFTSGGVGPTHDDVTVEAVARAFSRPVVRSQEIEAMLREYFGEDLRPRHLEMADVPEGAELVTSASVRWPTVRLANVFILPGQPEIFRQKLPILREHLGGDQPFISRAVHTSSEEAEIATLLEEICEQHPEVTLGSYPRLNDATTRVVVSVDGRDRAAVDRAVEALHAALPGASRSTQPKGS
jgi:molybdenum cofactor synthesis domain-containing protein